MNFKMVAFVATASFLSFVCIQGEIVMKQERNTQLSLDDRSVRVAADLVVEQLSQDEIKMLKKIIDRYQKADLQGDPAKAVKQLSLELDEFFFKQIKIQEQQAQSLASIKTAAIVIAAVLTLSRICGFLAGLLNALNEPRRYGFPHPPY